jgi:hypothetical protein
LNPTKQKSPTGTDLIELVFLALLAPLVAAGIQSVYVFLGAFRLYHALIGGAWFHEDEQPLEDSISLMFAYSVFFGLPTLLVLLPFRKRPLYRWLAWTASIAVLTLYYIYTQNSYAIN